MRCCPDAPSAAKASLESSATGGGGTTTSRSPVSEEPGTGAIVSGAGAGASVSAGTPRVNARWNQYRRHSWQPDRQMPWACSQKGGRRATRALDRIEGLPPGNFMHRQRQLWANSSVGKKKGGDTTTRTEMETAGSGKDLGFGFGPSEPAAAKQHLTLSFC